MRTLGITQSICPQCRSLIPTKVEAEALILLKLAEVDDYLVWVFWRIW